MNWWNHLQDASNKCFKCPTSLLFAYLKYDMPFIQHTYGSVIQVSVLICTGSEDGRNVIS